MSAGVQSTNAAARRSYGGPSAAGGTSAAAEPALQMFEAEQWDRFVSAINGGDVVQTSCWAEAKRALGFETCHVISRERGEILGGALMVIKRFGPFGGVAYVARGPLVARARPEVSTGLLDDLEQAARARRVRHLILQPPLGSDSMTAELTARGYAADAPAVAPTATVRLDLTRDLEDILAGMSSARRRNVRRGEERGIRVRVGSECDLDLFHALHQATARRQGFNALSKGYLRHHWGALARRAAVHLIFAYYDQRPLAGIWLTSFGDTMTYRLQGWAGEGSELYPNVACHWEAIRWAKAQGYRWYDLGGIERRCAELIAAGERLPEALLRSPATFKTQFGRELVLMPTARQFTFNPLARAAVNALYGRMARMRSFSRLMTRLRSG
jgi:lipid II:glycine glycyltransferase (peptidoglycan interpeptide bridge formation enzyme)